MKITEIFMILWVLGVATGAFVYIGFQLETLSKQKRELRERENDYNR